MSINTKNNLSHPPSSPEKSPEYNLTGLNVLEYNYTHIRDHILNDTNNLVLILNKNIILTYLSQIIELQDDEYNFVYECKKINKDHEILPNPKNVDKKIKYFKLGIIGFSQNRSYVDSKHIDFLTKKNKNKIQIFEFVSTSKNLASVINCVVADSNYGEINISSMSHCQEGQGGVVFEMKKKKNYEEMFKIFKNEFQKVRMLRELKNEFTTSPTSQITPPLKHLKLKNKTRKKKTMTLNELKTKTRKFENQHPQHPPQPKINDEMMKKFASSVNWFGISRNENDLAIELVKSNIHKIVWKNGLCANKNPNAMKIIKQQLKNNPNSNEIDWDDLNKNSNAMSIINAEYQTPDSHKIRPYSLCENKNAMDIILDIYNKHPTKIVWSQLCKNTNPRAIQLIKDIIASDFNSYYTQNEIDWEELCANENALEFILEFHPDKIHFNGLCKSKNPKAMELVKEQIAKQDEPDYNDDDYDEDDEEKTVNWACWETLCLNKNAFEIIQQEHLKGNESKNHINFNLLCENSHDVVVEIIKQRKDEINWSFPFIYTNENPKIMELIKQKMIENPIFKKKIKKSKMWEVLCANKNAIPELLSFTIS